VKAVFRIALGLALVGSAVVVSVGYDTRRYGRTPSDPAGAPRFVSIEPGSSVTTIARQLSDAGIIAYPEKFRRLARLHGRDTAVKAGEYTLSPAMTPNEVLTVLVSGNTRLRRFTVPEGYTMRQIAAALEQAGVTRASRFLAAATDPVRARQAGIKADTLEGYLFPDTYHFSKDTAADVVIAAMLDRFAAVFDPSWHERARRMGLSVHQVVTLASIIEKETGAGAERPLISSVFHNRIQRGMRLESDPTVIYGIDDFDGNLTREHLRRWTPYNTYQISGLPPGPIANPGAEALEAALYPADTDYLFFVSRNDGTHHFSTRLSEHNRAVRKYQLGRP
jgi:UPF0755 protein